MNIQWDAQHNTYDYKMCICLYKLKNCLVIKEIWKKHIDNYNFDLIFNELLEHFIEFYKRRIEK